jgi:hypothetical protein
LKSIGLLEPLGACLSYLSSSTVFDNVLKLRIVTSSKFASELIHYFASRDPEVDLQAAHQLLRDLLEDEQNGLAVKLFESNQLGMKEQLFAKCQFLGTEQFPDQTRVDIYKKL